MNGEDMRTNSCHDEHCIKGHAHQPPHSDGVHEWTNDHCVPPADPRRAGTMTRTAWIGAIAAALALFLLLRWLEWSAREPEPEYGQDTGLDEWPMAPPVFTLQTVKSG